MEKVELKQLSGRLRLGNTLIHRDLTPTLTQGRFRLSFDVSHSSYQRKIIVWLTDKAGKRGDGVAWDSVNPDQAGGTGMVQIVKLNGDQPLDWGNGGTVLAEGPSGHPALSDVPARFEFQLADGVLTVRVDGKTAVSARDAEFRQFDRLYLRGNDSQSVDRLILLP